MGSIKERLFNSNFKTKIILSFCVVMLTNMMVTSVSYYIYANRGTVREFRRNSQDIVGQINLHLEEKFTGLTQKVNALNNNLSFANPMKLFLQNDEMEWNPVLAGDVANIIAEVKASYDFVDSMYIYTPKGIFDDYMSLRKKDVFFEDTVMFRHFVYKPWETAAWFPAMENPLYESRKNVIPIVYQQKIGGTKIFTVINVSQDALADYLDNSYRSFEKIFIVDEEGNNICNFNPEAEAAVLSPMKLTEEEPEAFRRMSIDGNEYYMAASLLHINGWEICAMAETDVLLRDLQNIRLFIVLENIAVSICCLAIILWLSDKLTGSLMGLAGKMEEAGEVNYESYFEYPYNDEVGRLAKSFNHMIDQIQEHIRALEMEKEHAKEIQKQKRKAEMLALQAQINPHFLYNTLNMITWQAVDQGADEISVLSNALGKYFRISLSKGRESITIKEEAEHVNSYLEIQKIRYKSMMNYRIEIPARIESCYIVKLVLQPLVENALYHGIKGRDVPGSIWIHGRQEGDRIYLMVEDDGEGIEPEKLKLLNSRLEKGELDSQSGYGIYNVNNRLKLYYGEAYGLKLEARDTGGARATLVIPARTMEGMTEDV